MNLSHEFEVLRVREFIPEPAMIHTPERAVEVIEHEAARHDGTSLKPIEPHPPVRTLKIEAEGDSWKGLVKPKIRIMGRWLDRAGFRSGNRVSVMCVAPGVIELRSLVSTANEAQQLVLGKTHRLS